MYKLALDKIHGQFHRLNNTNITKSTASSEEVVVACSTFVCDPRKVMFKGSDCVVGVVASCHKHHTQPLTLYVVVFYDEMQQLYTTRSECC